MAKNTSATSVRSVRIQLSITAYDGETSSYKNGRYVSNPTGDKTFSVDLPIDALDTLNLSKLMPSLVAQASALLDMAIVEAEAEAEAQKAREKAEADALFNN